MKIYQFKSAVAEKGDKARLHCGVIAQEVIKAFKEEGLDPMYCICAVALAVNDIAPEQVLIDHDIKGPDKFEHADAGRHLYDAVQMYFPEYLPSAGLDLSMSQNSDA